MVSSKREARTHRMNASCAPSTRQSLAELLDTAVRSLRAAERVCVFTGPGLYSNERDSNLLDLPERIWQQLPASDSITPFSSQEPASAWHLYDQARGVVCTSQPGVVHMAVAMLAQRVLHCGVVTQNVDDLHERSGVRNVIHLHGSLMQMRCSSECSEIIPIPHSIASDESPRCDNCGASMRPALTLPGESLSMPAFDAARDCAIACDVFLSIGASGVLQPEASLPSIAATHGATVIVVNTSMEGQRLGASVLPLEGPPRVIVPRLVAEAFSGRKIRRSIDQSYRSID